MAHISAAFAGSVSGVMSCPCRQRPASSRRLSRGKPYPHHALVGKQFLHQRTRVGFRQADLEAVLAGIARPAHEPVLTRLDAVHEGQRSRFDPGAGKHCPGFRPLDGQEHAVERIDLAVEVLGQIAQMRFVGCRIPGIGHDHEAVCAKPGCDQVVEDAGLIVQEESQLRLRNFEAIGVERAGLRQQCGGVRPGHLKQLHVRNIEQSGMFACVKVLLHHAGRIGQRHRPARKRSEARACRPVQIL
jgi:hypothetical protein